MNGTQGRLFCFGLGYTAGRLARDLSAKGWTVAGTCQTAARRAEWAAEGIEAFVFDEESPLADAPAALAGATHLLSSVPPPMAATPCSWGMAATSGHWGASNGPGIFHPPASMAIRAAPPWTNDRP